MPSDKIPGMTRGLSAGDVVKVGKTVELEALDTPGHTMCHIACARTPTSPTLFCGDTLFNAGAGIATTEVTRPRALQDVFRAAREARPLRH